MIPDRQIHALLHLMDDPDEEVYSTVSQRLLDYGKGVIPSLEQLWEATEDEAVQERIETLIHRVHFTDLQAEFLDWSRSPSQEILRGAILVAKYGYPELNVPQLLTQFDKIRRNVWLELNNYLTPLEQVNVLNSMLYSFSKLEGNELSKREPRHFFLNTVLESRQGNAYSIGVIYLALCELLDVPLFAVDIPRQFVFAYIDTLRPVYLPTGTEDDIVQQIQFYVDPLAGTVYTQRDVDLYLRKIGATERELYFAPLTAKRVVWKMLEELALCYRYRREDAKADEVQELMRILVEE